MAFPWEENRDRGGWQASLTGDQCGVQRGWTEGQEKARPHLGTTGLLLGGSYQALLCLYPHVSTSHSSHSGADTPIIVLWAKWDSEKALRTPAHLAALMEKSLVLLPESASSGVEHWPEGSHHFTAVSCMTFGRGSLLPSVPTGFPYFRDSAGFVH